MAKAEILQKIQVFKNDIWTMPAVYATVEELQAEISGRNRSFAEIPDDRKSEVLPGSGVALKWVKIEAGDGQRARYARLESAKANGETAWSIQAIMVMEKDTLVKLENNPFLNLALERQNELVKYTTTDGKIYRGFQIYWPNNESIAIQHAGGVELVPSNQIQSKGAITFDEVLLETQIPVPAQEATPDAALETTAGTVNPLMREALSKSLPLANGERIHPKVNDKGQEVYEFVKAGANEPYAILKPQVGSEVTSFFYTKFPFDGSKPMLAVTPTASGLTVSGRKVLMITDCTVVQLDNLLRDESAPEPQQ